MMKKKTALRLTGVVLAVCLALTGCSVSPNVMKVDGKNVSEGVYAYFYGYMSALYSLYGYSADATQLDSSATEQVKQYYAVKDLAKQLNLSLTTDENKSFLDSKNSEIETMGGRSAYNSFLKAIGISDNQYNDLGKSYTLYQKIADYYYGDNGTERPSDDTLKTEYEKDYIHATHILISTQEAETDEERATLKEKAEEVLAKAKAGEDFYSLIREYGEDPGIADNPEEGYYFTTGEMDSAFETAAFALQVGEISDLVTSSSGYHIILRLPMDEEHVQSVLDDGSYYSTYCTKLLSDKISAVTDKMSIEKLKAYDSMDMTDASNAWYNYLYAASSSSSSSSY